MTALPNTNNSVGITPEEQLNVDKEFMQQQGMPFEDPVGMLDIAQNQTPTEMDDAQSGVAEAEKRVADIMQQLQDRNTTPDQAKGLQREAAKARGELKSRGVVLAEMATPRMIDPAKHAKQDMLPGGVWSNPNRGAEQQRIVILPGTGQMVMIPVII